MDAVDLNATGLRELFDSVWTGSGGITAERNGA